MMAKKAEPSANQSAISLVIRFSSQKPEKFGRFYRFVRSDSTVFSGQPQRNRQNRRILANFVSQCRLLPQ
jgi:hypothetical protein